MSEGATTRWLPVDTILKTDGARATDAALIPLATEAQRIRRVTVWGASLLCVLAMALALGSETAGGWGVAGVAVAAVAFAIVLQKQKLWDGSSRWLRWYGRPISEPDLPTEALALLGALRAGTRHARFRRGQLEEWKELPVLLLRGPFGPLILSCDPDVQGLALWDWFGGDRLSIEVEVRGSRKPEGEIAARAGVAGENIEHDQTAGESNIPPVLDQRLVSQPAERLSQFLERNQADADEGSAQASNRVRLDHRLLMAPDELHRLLDVAYRPDTRGSRAELIIDTFSLSNELLHRGLEPKTIKELVRWVVACLKTANRQTVYLVSGDGRTVARRPFEVWYQKIKDPGYKSVGFRENSDSSEWIEQALAGRYDDIRKALDGAETQLGAS